MITSTSLRMALLLGSCLGLAVAIPAQDVDQQKKLAELRDQKLRSGFLKQAAWFTDFAKAKAAARPEGKLIFIYFTRSYAPSPACEAVEQSILSDPKFAALAKQLVLYCHVTSRVAADQDQRLLPSLGGESFPFVVVADHAGRRIASSDRLSSLADIAAMLDGEVAEFRSLQARAAKGDKVAKAGYLLARLRLGHMKPKAIESELATADYLTQQQETSIRRILASLEVMEIINSIDEKDPKSRRAAAERMLAMMKVGRIPSDRLANPFWQVLLGHADETEDPDLFDMALQNIKKLPGGRLDPKWLRKMETKLRVLRFMKDRKKKSK